MSLENTARALRPAPQPLLLAALGLALTSIIGAWIFELGFGYAPCKLCLLQRWPYYVGIPIGLAAWIAGGARTDAGRALLLLFVLTFVVSAGLGVYHSGVEWKFWAGPADCGGRLVEGPASVLDLRNAMRAAKVVRCDDAALRVLGLSFAGWNVVVSTFVAWLAALGLKPR